MPEYMATPCFSNEYLKTILLAKLDVPFSSAIVSKVLTKTISLSNKKLKFNTLKI
jgi:hypothetical protein